jgi:hypothetical protein
VRIVNDYILKSKMAALNCGNQGESERRLT